MTKNRIIGIGETVLDIICNFLQENGVSAEYVCRHENVKSHISLAFLDEHNDAQYVFYKDHAMLSLDGKLPAFSKDDVVLFGSFFAINPVIRSVVGGLLRKAHEAGAWLYYDVNFRKNYIADLPDLMPNIEENMRLADVVRGSMEDFEYLFGLHDGEAIYERVNRYCQTLILTNGARQIRVYTPEGCETYPVQPIETVSTVGAGDNFNAGYIYAKIAIENGKLNTENSTDDKNNCQLSTHQDGPTLESGCLPTIGQQHQR